MGGITFELACIFGALVFIGIQLAKMNEKP